MLVKTSELIGPALDWAVAKALGILRSDTIQSYAGGPYVEGLLPTGYHPVAENVFDTPLSQLNYSTNWSQGGLLIEREKITLHAEGPEKFPVWISSLSYSVEVTYSTGRARRLCTMRGNTPLVAAMRCYVASKLGDEIEIPEELCK